MYLYGRINPESGQLYAPNKGAAMALIFTLMVVLASYGLNLAARRQVPKQFRATTLFRAHDLRDISFLGKLP